jgi:trans-aconitate methyltransferase
VISQSRFDSKCDPGPPDSSLSVDSDAQAEHIFKALSEDGQVTMPMQEAFFAARFGQTRAVQYALDDPSRTADAARRLGCGDGFVTEFIRSKSPGITFYLMDGSEFMLKKAKQRLRGHGVLFLAETFQNHLDKRPEFGKYDFVYSVNVIHHLDLLEKKRLYFRVFEELKPGGLFVNSDPVTPASE